MKRYLLPALFFCIVLVIYGVSACVASYRFDVGCGGHLKRAADANTVELALSELDGALNYAEGHGLTSGTTAVILPTPAEDISFWYKNLVASREELKKLGPEATQLVRTNTLMKLRETLLDKSENGEKVTIPPGISLHPLEKFYCLGIYGSLFALLVISGLFFWFEIIREPSGPFPRRQY